MTRYRTIAVLTVFLFFPVSPCVKAADTPNQVHPYLSVRGEYSDNLNLTADNQKKDFITTLSPGVKFSNMNEISGVTLDARAGTVLYNEYTDLNYVMGNVNLDTKALTASNFNFYLKEYFIRSDTPREREYFITTSDNKYVLATETQRGVYWRNVVSPTIEYQFGPESRIGVTYRNNVYQTEVAGSDDSQENYVSPFLTFWINRQNAVSLSYALTNAHFETLPDFNNHKISASYMLRPVPRATISLNGAYAKHISSIENHDYAVYESSLGLSYILSPTLSVSAQAGYYWQDREIGKNINGITFKADIAQLDVRTTYRLSVQGGYIEDYFTSLNLGFRKYYRATGSITHFPTRRLSVGCLGSLEWTESEQDRRDTIWGAGVNLSYLPFPWLKFSLEYTYNQRNTGYQFEATGEYKENQAMLTVIATY